MNRSFETSKNIKLLKGSRYYSVVRFPQDGNLIFAGRRFVLQNTGFLDFRLCNAMFSKKSKPIEFKLQIPEHNNNRAGRQDKALKTRTVSAKPERIVSRHKPKLAKNLGFCGLVLENTRALLNSKSDSTKHLTSSGLKKSNKQNLKQRLLK